MKRTLTETMGYSYQLAALAMEFQVVAADLVEMWSERAAIREYEGNMTREAAEKAALGDVREALENRR